MKTEQLSPREQRRYAKHIMIPGVGEEGQLKLKNSRILIIGAGGLGCPVLQYLTAAGVGHIGLVEFDSVDESNLQRQILYGSSDIGKLKSIISRHRLQHQNDLVDFNIFNIKLAANNALGIFDSYDIIIDATDNYDTRYLISDACVISNTPMVHGAIYKYEGQVSVFNHNKGPSYRCFNPKINEPGLNPAPEETGLFGVLPGIAGTHMANEVIKIIIGLDHILSGKMLIFNVLLNTSYTITINKDPQNLNITTLEEDN